MVVETITLDHFCKYAQGNRAPHSGETGLKFMHTALFTNEWFNNWKAVGRLFGLTCKHWSMKSRASSDNVLGMEGSSPLPILNNACIYNNINLVKKKSKKKKYLLNIYNSIILKGLYRLKKKRKYWCECCMYPF